MASASCGRSVLNSCTKSSKRACCCKLFSPGGRVADSQPKAVPAIAEIELALEIGAPEVVWRGAGRERRAGRPVPWPPRDLDQAVPVEHGVDRALGRNADVAVQSADQELTDLAGTPVGLVALGATIRLSICHGSWLA